MKYSEAFERPFILFYKILTFWFEANKLHLPKIIHVI